MYIDNYLLHINHIIYTYYSFKSNELFRKHSRFLLYTDIQGSNLMKNKEIKSSRKCNYSHKLFLIMKNSPISIRLYIFVSEFDI